jgi:hypothetical protein
MELILQDKAMLVALVMVFFQLTRSAMQAVAEVPVELVVTEVLLLPVTVGQVCRQALPVEQSPVQEVAVALARLHAARRPMEVETEH